MSSVVAAPPPAQYTVGIRIACEEDPRLHVTMAYVGECDEARLAELRRALQSRAHLAAHFQPGEKDMFGPKNDILVVKCKFTTPESAAVWKSFYEQYAELSPGMPPPKPVVQNYHVTIKHPKVLDEVLAKKDKHLCGTSVFLKQLGQKDPVCEFTLPVVNN